MKNGKSGKLAANRVSENPSAGYEQARQAPKSVAGKGKVNWPHQKVTVHEKAPNKLGP